MTPEKLDELERLLARWEPGALGPDTLGLIDDGTLRDLIAAARREAALRWALEEIVRVGNVRPFRDYALDKARALLSKVPQ